VDLSYQPTYRHVRELEAAGAIATEREGRQVLCRLAASEEAAVWLSLASIEDAQRMPQQDGDGLAGALVSAARAGRLGETLGLAIVSGGNGRQVVAIVPDAADAAAILTRAQAVCQTHGAPDAEALALSREQFARWLLDEWTPAVFAERAQVLAGHQALWLAVLDATPAGAARQQAPRSPAQVRPARRPEAAPEEDVAEEERFID
jgi:hypothetical protein